MSTLKCNAENRKKLNNCSYKNIFWRSLWISNQTYCITMTNANIITLEHSNVSKDSMPFCCLYTRIVWLVCDFLNFLCSNLKIDTTAVNCRLLVSNLLSNFQHATLLSSCLSQLKQMTSPIWTKMEKSEFWISGDFESF